MAWATVGVALMLAACAGAPGPAPAVVASAGPSGPGASPPAIRIVAEQDANLHLWVSNQSFEDDPVRVTVTIDGVEVITRPFTVEGQHNWILFPVKAPSGPHVVRAVSDTGAELRQGITLPDVGRRYAVLDYWYYVDDGERRFTWRVQATPIGFD
jgi:hypothetical protein